MQIEMKEEDNHYKGELIKTYTGQLKSQKNIEKEDRVQKNNILKLTKRYMKNRNNQPIIAASTFNGDVIIYDQTKHEVISTLKPTPSSNDPITDISWFDECNKLLYSDNNTIYLYDVERQKQITKLEGHSDTIQSINFNSAHNQVISGGFDHVILIWDINRYQKPVNCIMAHSHAITSLSFSQDNRHILSSAGDGFTRIWDCFTGDCLVTLCQNNETVPTFSHYNYNSKYVLQSTLSNQINLWNWANSKITRSFKGHKNESMYLNCFFLKDNANNYSHIIQYSEDGYIYVWDMYTQEIVVKQFIEECEKKVIQKRLFVYEKDIDQYKNIFLFDFLDGTIEQYQLNLEK